MRDFGVIRPDQAARFSVPFTAHTVGESDTFDDHWQLLRTLQAAPCLCGGLNELEDHELRGLLRQCSLGPHGFDA